MPGQPRFIVRPPAVHRGPAVERPRGRYRVVIDADGCTTVVGAPACCAPIREGALGEGEATELARTFAALADPVRLRLLSLVASSGEVCSCDLQVALDRSQPTISHHTKSLVEAGLLTGEKRGRWVWWRIVPERLDAVRAALG